MKKNKFNLKLIFFYLYFFINIYILSIYILIKIFNLKLKL